MMVAVVEAWDLEVAFRLGRDPFASFAVLFGGYSGLHVRVAVVVIQPDDIADVPVEIG